MAYTANGVSVIDNNRVLVVDGVTVISNTRTAVGVFANTAPTSALTPSTFQGSVSGYAAGGFPTTNTIDKFPFSADTNATDVGDLTVGSYGQTGGSSTTHGYVAGGFVGASPPINVTSNTKRIQKFPFSVDTNSTNIANLQLATRQQGGQSSETNGYISGGRVDPTNTARIEKYSFASDTDSITIGNLTVVRHQSGGHSSTTHGYTAGGFNGPADTTALNTIDRFPFSTDTNASDVGDLTVIRHGAGGTQSSTASGYTSGGITTPGPTNVNTIDKFPFATNTNATDVGDLTAAKQAMFGNSSTTSGYASAGYDGSVAQSAIEKFPFASNTNATSIGNLTVARHSSTAAQQARTLS